MIPDPGNPAAQIHQEPFRIPTKSLNRLKVAAMAVKHYEETSRELTAPMMQWDPRLKNFERQWKALGEASNRDGDEIPKVGRTLGIVKYLEAYENYATTVFGVRTCRLSYVIRTFAVVPVAAPALATHCPHSTLFGSISGDRVARLSHTDPLFREDDGMVFDHLEVGVRGTKFQNTIEPFKRLKQGRSAFLALKAQHAGRAMWDGEVQTNQDFLLNRKWNGGTSFTLERFLGQHRSAYVALTRCAEHVTVQLPDERTRVGYVLKNIECTDADVKATVASIKVDDSPTGLRQDFERSVALLLPTCPVKRKRSGKRKSAEISSVTVGADEGAEVSAIKVSRGPITGIELRYYKPDEYHKLTKAQKKELKEHRKPPADEKAGTYGPADNRRGRRPNGKGGHKGKKSLKAKVASVMKEIEEEAADRHDAMNEFKALISQATGVSSPSDGTKAGGSKQNPNKEEARKADVASAALLNVFERMIGGGSARKGANRG